MSTSLVIFVVYTLCYAEIHCRLLQSTLVILGGNYLEFLDKLGMHYISFLKYNNIVSFYLKSPSSMLLRTGRFGKDAMN